MDYQGPSVTGDARAQIYQEEVLEAEFWLQTLTRDEIVRSTVLHQHSESDEEYGSEESEKFDDHESEKDEYDETSEKDDVDSDKSQSDTESRRSEEVSANESDHVDHDNEDEERSFSSRSSVTGSSGSSDSESSSSDSDENDDDKEMSTQKSEVEESHSEDTSDENLVTHKKSEDETKVDSDDEPIDNLPGAPDKSSLFRGAGSESSSESEEETSHVDTPVSAKPQRPTKRNNYGREDFTKSAVEDTMDLKQNRSQARSARRAKNRLAKAGQGTIPPVIDLDQEGIVDLTEDNDETDQTPVSDQAHNEAEDDVFDVS
jgi:hypothetical protein